MSPSKKRGRASPPLFFPCICIIFFRIGYNEVLPRCASSVLRRRLIAHRGEMALAFTTPDYAHLGLISFDLFEVVNGGAVSPQQHGCQGPQTQSPASRHNAACVGNADMRCGRGVNVQLQTAACESASASSSLSPPL